MSSRFDFVKTTVVGGAVFLVPAVIIVIVLGKFFGALKAFAKALAPVFGIKSMAGGVALDVVAVIITLMICFAAGLIARQASAKRLREKLDRTLLNSFPGYAFVKGFADNLRQTEEMAGSFHPVAVRFDDYSQVAFETNRRPDGTVAIYLPGAPNPWSGTIVFVACDRVQSLPISLTEAIRSIRTLGKTSVEATTPASATTLT
jgi:uncharacterized membrane protein